MNIAVITPPREFNLGNGIFADGGLYLVNKFFSNHNIYPIEYFQSCQPHRANKTQPFTNGTLKWIDKNVDLVIFIGGCCLSEVMFDGFFKPLFDTKKPLIGLGFSCTDYNENEKNIAREVLNNSKAIITRDKYLYNLLCDSEKVLEGMCGGFFCKEYYKCPEEEKIYAVSNIESGAILNTKTPSTLKCGNAFEEAEKLLKYSDDVYIVSNNSNLNYIPDHPSVIQVTTCNQLWSLYKNASAVSTTRAHTAVNCLTEGTKVFYYGDMNQRALGLFEQCDIDLSNGETDTEEARLKIKKTKEVYLSNLETFFNENNLT